MVQIHPLEAYLKDSRPKRLMQYLLIWCTKGSATMVVDDKELELLPWNVLTITSGQYHYFKDLTGAKGYLLEFSLDYFCKDDSDLELVFQNGLFCHFDMNEVIPISDGSFLTAQLETISEELSLKPYQYLISVHSRIELILIYINRNKLDRGNEIWKPDALFLKFLEAVRSNFGHNYPLSHFARLLDTTETKLNEQAKIHAGKTAQNVIYGLMVSEAKRLLRYEEYRIKEIAFALGFTDPFYFSNFFKKHTGSSPKAYKKEYSL
jgi:AraC-like DNA-binding protein